MNLQTSSVSRYADLDRGPRRAALILVGLIISFLVITIIWMNFATLDISVHATGSVVPSSRVQQIQSLEGGIIKELPVTEGQHVHKGALLARLDAVEYDAELKERLQNYWSMLARLARLDAEMHDREPVFPAEVTREAPELVKREKSLWLSRKAARTARHNAATGIINQREQELAEARAMLDSLNERKQISLAQLEIETSLYQQDAGSRAEYLNAQADDSRMQGEINTTRITLSRLKAGIEEARATRQREESEFLAEVGQEYTELEAKLAALRESLPSSKDKVLRRDLYAPKEGIVNRLLVTTIGGVVKAGESIMEIVPVDGSLLISTRVKPADIAFIKPGQPALIRISAYDSSVFGALDGEVVRVGADTIFDEKQKPYFDVQLKTEKNYIGKPEQHMNINPGMAVDASIKTGKRTVMEYLLKPIVKNFQTALHER